MSNPTMIRVFTGLAIGALLLTIGLYRLKGQGQADGELSFYDAVPAFTLTDHQGAAFDSARLEGKVWLANFVYTRCTMECPLLTSRMKQVADRLEAERLLGGPVEIVSFSVDPGYDNPERLAAYARRFGITSPSWHFLTGPVPQVESLLGQAFKVGIRRWEGEEAHKSATLQPGASYAVAHSFRFVLVDAEGRIRSYYPGLEVDIDTVVEDVENLVAQGGKS